MVEKFDAKELDAWWHTQADKEIAPMISKMVEYGGQGRATDLIDIGRDLAKAMRWEDISDADAAELGIYFYIRGKMGRWFAAISEKRPVSDDTLYDIGIYVRMVQRIRDRGGWPV